MADYLMDLDKYTKGGRKKNNPVCEIWLIVMLFKG